MCVCSTQTSGPLTFSGTGLLRTIALCSCNSSGGSAAVSRRWHLIHGHTLLITVQEMRPFLSSAVTQTSMCVTISLERFHMISQLPSIIRLLVRFCTTGALTLGSQPKRVFPYLSMEEQQWLREAVSSVG